MKNKFTLLIIVFFLVSSCSGNIKRSDKSDEFLIDKKNPLVMPPDIDELPKPKQNLEENENNDDFKSVIKTQKIENSSDTIEMSGSLQESIIKKIEE
tara:strand:- start:36 stop:326 length:291 start_codon:yes stop_codon:yes gene_type:complete